jgi:serine/threonine protein kinase
MLAIDTVLQGRYRIIHQLGQGGMGAVYKAIDERLNKTVAIKEVVFEPETAVDDSQRNIIQRAFQREANSLVKAKHEAVPDVTDYFSELESRFLVMEYVEGDDLAKMLEKRGTPFSFEEVLPWINQLLEALEYLHNLMPPILHRDVKPQNLKLNERQKIKLLDFGIARSSDKNSTLSQNTFLAATLNYAPFEQVLRVIDPMFREFILLKHRDKAEKFLAQDTDTRCDIFGVGATFYHLLTNQMPVDVTKRALGIWEKGTDELENPSAINPEIPPGVSRWLLKAMAFERENRFTSAGEMKDALQKITAESKDSLPIIGQTRLEQAIIAREHQLMQARTERLIEPERTERDIFPSGNLSSTTGSAANFEVTEEFTPEEILLNDFKATETDFSAQSTSGNLPDKSYFYEEPFTKLKEPAPQNDKIIPPQTKDPATNTRKYILALAIMGILLFAISVVGLYAVVSLINNEPTPKENNPTIENKPIPQTPQTSPSVEENVNTTEGNTETKTEGNTETNTRTIINTAGKETQKTPPTKDLPSVTPTSKIFVEQTPKSTPTASPTVTKTPTPQGADYYVLCYIKSDKGTFDKIRKNKCTECPKGVLCELIFYKK